MPLPPALLPAGNAGIVAEEGEGAQSVALFGSVMKESPKIPPVTPKIDVHTIA
jgi:hypothetical protein